MYFQKDSWKDNYVMFHCFVLAKKTENAMKLVSTWEFSIQ